MSQISWAIEVYLTGERPYVLKSEAEEKIEKLQADLEEARATIQALEREYNHAQEANKALGNSRFQALKDLEEARAALREIVSIKIDMSLSPIDAANKMCRVAVDALVATEEIDG